MIGVFLGNRWYITQQCLVGCYWDVLAAVPSKNISWGGFSYGMIRFWFFLTRKRWSR